MVSTVSFAYAHPYLDGISILTFDGQIPDSQILGFEKETDEDKEEYRYAFLSKEWGWKYFILLLSMIIALIMCFTLILAYYAEIQFTIKKNLKLTNHS